MISLVDYGGGNVGSVLKAIEYLGHHAQVVDQPRALGEAEKIILPGQGHFGAMMNALAERGMVEPLRDIVRSATSLHRTPARPRLLGICLGLQVLYEASDEAPDVAGLGVLRGRVTRFEGSLKVPHVGWSQLEIARPSGVLAGIASGSFVYYCHSYYGPVTQESVAVTCYGQQFAAAVEVGNVWAVQFHPEKSSAVGLRVLKNFLEA
ncbi:MAG TPA: imidazole glycerol phosphate synthase subunit HisH [Terriglobia bacterium]|nr:imidazole glycerol phosphate synthase subunit HisH [Terriglobia bacterium]